MTTWILVADRAQARIFTPDEAGEVPLRQHVDFVGRAGYLEPELQTQTALAEQAGFIHPESQLAQQNVESDRPGRFKSNGSARQAGEAEQDFKHQTAESFARVLVDYLEKARLENQFDKLVLIAAPLFLGVVRKTLSPSLTQMVTLEIDKDYTKLKAAKIRQHLPDNL